LLLGGHLEVVQWAREHDCTWDARSRASAAAYRHLAVAVVARGRLPMGRVDTCVVWGFDPLGASNWMILKWARAHD